MTVEEGGYRSRTMTTCELDECDYDYGREQRSFLGAAVKRQLAQLGLALALTAVWAGVAVLFTQ